MACLHVRPDASMVEALGIQDQPLWAQRVQDYYGWQKKSNKGVKTSNDSWTWEEGSSSRWSTTSTRGSSKRGQSVPVDPSKRTNPEEQGLPWRDLGEIDVDQDYLYPVDAVIPCPVEKVEQPSPEQQPVCIQWILHVLKLDHKVDKDPQVYCSYCDMNNHPRFSCKHARKHRNPLERHHCTLCAAKHPPFLCPEHKSTVVQASRTGTRQSTSVQSKRIVKQTIDGAQWSHMSMSMVQSQLHSINRKHHSLNVQQRG